MAQGRTQLCRLRLCTKSPSTDFRCCRVSIAFIWHEHILTFDRPGEILPEFPKPTHNRSLRCNNPTLLPTVILGHILQQVVPRHPNHDRRGARYKDGRRRRPFDAFEKQLNTITCGGGISGNLGHPHGHRQLTVHEVILCQGGGPEHVIVGLRTAALARAGDGFPSNVAKLIYDECVKSLRNIRRHRKSVYIQAARGKGQI